MNTFAYCTQSFMPAMKKIAGVTPLTCPPVTADTFDPAVLTGKNLIFFDLHGEPGDGQWYGDEHLPAVTADQIRSIDLGGAIVFGLNCYLADDDSPMLDALLSAGASFVIAGDGQNFAGKQTVFGCGELALWFRRYLKVEKPPVALWRAKQAARIDLQGHDDLLADMLGFKAFHRIKEEA